MITASVGTKAYVDTLHFGLVPCIVTAIHPETIDVRITANRGRFNTYTKGENINRLHSSVLPRSAVYTPRGSYFPRIRPYRWTA